ncbi:ABC transporter permease [Lactiplantibacillus modestisalitolerans]|uniref:ABC transporter permease n=1 Tax=Lactiplantibacillus modestisalitolerans TaxID=1457219 RepID=A0ABV5WVP7_9LACO|nr:ABC transporter permease [Lactiplantibacillus modestisalitolerans]
MNELYHQRLGRHLQRMLRYLRLVFNDHFVIALMFFVGGLGLAYSNWLKTVGPHDQWLLVVLGGILLLGSRIGRIATLIEPADTVFLLPRERDFHQYLARAWRYSWGLAQLVQLALVILVMPLFVLITRASGWALVALVGLQLAIKDYQLTLAMIKLYQVDGAFSGRYRRHPRLAPWSTLTSWLVSGLLLVLGLAVSPWLGFAVAVIVALVSRGLFRRLWPQSTVAWRADVTLEANRMLGIYRFFNLFTDVPMVQGSVKRRRYLDWVLRWLPKNQQHAFSYLFGRGMLRGTEFSGLVARLTIIGAILLYFSGHGWLAIGLDVLFLYLIGFQLLPFYKRYDNIVFTHIYPLSAKQRLRNFQRLLTIVLTTTAIIFILAVALSNAPLVQVGILGVVNLIEIYLLVAWYAKMRLA